MQFPIVQSVSDVGKGRQGYDLPLFLKKKIEWIQSIICTFLPHDTKKFKKCSESCQKTPRVTSETRYRDFQIFEIFCLLTQLKALFSLSLYTYISAPLKLKKSFDATKIDHQHIKESAFYSTSLDLMKILFSRSYAYSVDFKFLILRNSIQHSPEQRL